MQQQIFSVSEQWFDHSQKEKRLASHLSTGKALNTDTGDDLLRMSSLCGHHHGMD